ncbi:hypothetical protein GCM10023329_57800 [Streptomyces sanyensis]|uniref:Uncharacterized protein n=1 Tax=Streptomyces sanyensis TaxID=568869 RepID=A0ABP9BL78_9ACTN
MLSVAMMDAMSATATRSSRIIAARPSPTGERSTPDPTTPGGGAGVGVSVVTGAAGAAGAAAAAWPVHAGQGAPADVVDLCSHWEHGMTNEPPWFMETEKGRHSPVAPRETREDGSAHRGRAAARGPYVGGGTGVQRLCAGQRGMGRGFTR